MPVAHADEGAVLHVPVAVQDAFERPRLLLRQLQQRGLAAEDHVVLERRLGPPPRDQPAQRRAQPARHAQDRRVGEEVDEEWAHALGRVGAAEVEQNNRHATPCHEC